MIKDNLQAKTLIGVRLVDKGLIGDNHLDRKKLGIQGLTMEESLPHWINQSINYSIKKILLVVYIWLRLLY